MSYSVSYSVLYVDYLLYLINVFIILIKYCDYFILYVLLSVYI